jgi:hypothetical protein
MTTVLVIYVLYASVVLIWSSLDQSDVGLRHLVISAALLEGGAVLGTDPIVIELRGVEPGLQRVSSLPGSLVVSRTELNSLVRWAPRCATLVFCEGGESRYLDSRVEEALLELGISAVYWLDVQTEYEPSMHVQEQVRGLRNCNHNFPSALNRRRLP